LSSFPFLFSTTFIKGNRTETIKLVNQAHYERNGKEESVNGGGEGPVTVRWGWYCNQHLKVTPEKGGGVTLKSKEKGSMIKQKKSMA